MAVTEVALLHLKPSVDVTSPSLMNGLRKAKDTMREFSGFPFYWYHCIEDPQLIYAIGGWESVDHHMQEWIPSSGNQELLTLLKDAIDIDWLLHIDLDRREKEVPVSEKVLSIGRFSVKRNQRAQVEKLIDGAKGGLVDYIGGQEKIASGWRVDQEQEEGSADVKEEWVLFGGWESVDKHLKFAQTEEFKEFFKLTELFDRADVKHGVKMEF